ncbi:MAG TPA: hypothetical protein VKB46_25395 [Pyrinomonadaceae bacterium]|nr:hypothetical protein [Pyrinomonadaceae bacterium]
MARGWESKAVADQIEEVESRTPAGNAARITQEDRQKKERLQSLLLSKARILQQLETARHPAYRGVLNNGLRAIEAEIEELSRS